MIKWLHVYCPRANTRVALEAAAKVDKLSLLQWITTNFECVTWDPELARLAAQNGHLETLQWIWLHPKSSPFSERDAINAIECAAMNGHLPVVKWLDQQQQWSRDRTNGRFEFSLRHAVLRGHLEVARYLAQNGISQLSRTILQRIVSERQDGATVECVDGPLEA